MDKLRAKKIHRREADCCTAYQTFIRLPRICLKKFILGKKTKQVRHLIFQLVLEFNMKNFTNTNYS